MSGQPEGGSGPFRSPRKATGTCPPAGPAAQPSIEQPHDEIEAVTQAEEPGPSGPGGVRGAPPKRLTPLAVGSRAQPWSLFGYFLANQKVTPRRVGGQGIYFFSYPPAEERPTISTTQMVNTPYKKDTDLSPPFTANRRRRHLGRGSPERGAVARRRLRGRPAGPLPPQGIKIRRRHHPTEGRASPAGNQIRRRHLKQNTSTQCKNSRHPSQKDS